MKNILILHGVNSTAGSWENGFSGLESKSRRLLYVQYPSRSIIGDYLTFVLSKGKRDLVVDTAARYVFKYDQQLAKIGEEIDLVVTHSFGQVVCDMLKDDGGLDLEVPVVNLGGPFSHHLIGMPLRVHMCKHRHLNTYSVINKADGIPTFFGKHVDIPCKKRYSFYKNRLGDDHDVEVYLRSEIVKKLIADLLGEKHE